MNPTRRSLLAGVGAGALGLAGCAAPSESPQQQTDSDYTDIYRQVADSVVEIHVTDGEQTVGQGSGFVIADGAIVTNHHVVDVGPTVSVRLSTHEWAEVTVVGSDPHSDIAVLDVDGADVDVPASLSFVDEPLSVGEEVLAIGSPFDLSGSLSQGVISGRNRSIPGPGAYKVPDTIQTDVALNPGSSGGPIVDLAGNVAGIVIANQGQTVGFAISAALARRVVPELRETGSYEHSRLGISITEVGPALAEANGLAEPGGLLVVRVDPDGPADGVLQPSIESEDSVSELVPENESQQPREDDPQSPGDDPQSPGDDPQSPGDDPEPTTPDGSTPTGGDVIVELAGEPIPDSDTLSSVLALETSPGQTVPVTVIRDGSRETVEVTLGSRPTE